MKLRRKSAEIEIGNIRIGGSNPWALIAGPCAIESEEMAKQTASVLAEVTDKLNIPFVFKGSYDKANRLSIESKRGIGLDNGLEILANIREEIKIPVLTDIHESIQVNEVARYVDCLQIPAFLCRQTDLVVAAARTGKPINIKKGQFAAPHDMIHIVQKARIHGSQKIMLTERGTTFGYRDLMVDMRNIPIMAEFGYPVILDISHSQQNPGASGGKTGGSRDFIPHMALCGLALEIDAIYMEVHPDPDNAISDRKTQWPLSEIEAFLSFLKQKA